MSSTVKVSFCLLISIILYMGGLYFSYTGGFKALELRFYEPRVIENIDKKLSEIQENYKAYSSELDNEFRIFLKGKSVKSYIEREPSKEKMDERDQKAGLLFQKLIGLEGMRLVESDGIHIHFSTYREDILSESEKLIAYTNYTDINKVPYSLLEAKDGETNTKIYFDSVKNKLIFSYPFYDVYTAYRGTFLFYVSGSDFTRYLTDNGVVQLNTRGAVVSPKGFVFNIPFAGRVQLVQKIEELWSKKNSKVEKLIESDEKKDNLFVITNTYNDMKTGWISPQTAFEFSPIEKQSLLICLFITLFLIIFILFNLKQEDMVIVRRRIRRFQYELLKEYIERKDTKDWKSLAKEITQRKVDINSEIKHSLGRTAKKHSHEVDEMLEASWTDIVAAMSGNVAAFRRMREEKHSDPIEEISIRDVKIKPSVNQPVVTPVIPVAVEQLKNADQSGTQEDIEELEEIPDAEPVEELEEIADAEPVEELEELSDAEPVEELEEIPDAEPVEELEEIADAEPVEELEEIADAEPVEELEEISDAEPVEELEEIADAEPVEELEEIADAEPVEELEEIADAEPVEELEEIPDAEPVEELEEIPDAEIDDIFREAKIANNNIANLSKPAYENIEEYGSFIDLTKLDVQEISLEEAQKEFDSVPVDEQTAKAAEKAKEDAKNSFTIFAPDFGEF